MSLDFDGVSSSNSVFGDQNSGFGSGFGDSRLANERYLRIQANRKKTLRTCQEFFRAKIMNMG